MGYRGSIEGRGYFLPLARVGARPPRDPPGVR
jgi:hypothetical protein